jgi:hypothetical protein
MKNGYVALFGLAVAFSAYQGTSGVRQNSASSESKASGSAVAGNQSSRPAPLSPGAEPFPTIAGGICRLTIDGGATPPCGQCNAVCPASDLRDLIEKHFRSGTDTDKDYLAAHWNVPQSAQPAIKFVIASLPDPVHTHMALLFDRGIETIQKSAQASGYLFSRAWMPWDISTHAESTDFTVRLSQEQLVDQKESLPGLMIFDRSGGSAAPTAFLFVFVVGETPTGGLHLEQFQNALKIRQSILAGADSKLAEARTLRIDGPSASGSLSSLYSLLKTQHNRFDRIMIRSGSISSYHAMHKFCEDSRIEWPTPDRDARPDFATFQFNDEYEEFYLSYFFRERYHEHSHIAVLSEDETAFGNQEVRQFPEKPAATQVQNSQAKVEPDPCPAQPPKPFFHFARLYFPREIAQLRDAYQRDVKSQAADVAKNQPQGGLSLSLSVTGNDDDSVGAYSPLQTPLSQESILQAIVATLRKQHARMVLIRASDTLDQVFLCRYLRQNYPQARLITVGADLLMMHDSNDPRFHGVLAVTPYPLLAGTDFPALASDDVTGKEDVHRLFSDSYSLGDFNALQSLLAPPPQNPANLPAADYEQFGWPSFLQSGADLSQPEPWRAHLWLTAVGRDGFWPVTVLDDVPLKSLQDVRPGIEKPEPTVPPAEGKVKLATAYSVHLSVGWTILWVVSVGLTVLFSLLLLGPRTPFSASELLGRFVVRKSPQLSSLLLTGALLLLGAQTVFFYPCIVWLGRFGQLELGKGLFDGLPFVALGYFVGAALLGAACAKGLSDRKSPRLAFAGCCICGIAILVAGCFTICLWSSPLSDRLGSFAYRYTHIGSGVSPLLPLLFLLAAWVWWCWQSFTGVASTEEKKTLLPDVSSFTEATVPGAADRVRLKALSKQANGPLWGHLGILPLGRAAVVAAFLGFGVIVILMWPPEIAEAFEDTPYKWIFWVLLYCSLLLMCYLGTHIVVLWLGFRTLLRSIERVPFRRGFADLKSLTWKPLWELAGNGRQEFVQLLGREVDALTQIQNGNWLDPGLAKAIDDARDVTNELSAAYEKSMPKPTPENADEVQRKFEDLQSKLAKSAAEALIYATKKWKQETYAPPLAPADAAKDADDKNPATEAPATDLTTRAIERFLCLFYVNVILVPLRRLQTLILALAGAFVFVLISYSSYPFESRESFHVLLISIFFVISLVVGIVYGQMYANPLLSRITNTKPGELGLDFWVRIGTFVFVPLLSLLSVQFPDINNFLFSWLQPALQSIK